MDGQTPEQPLFAVILYDPRTRLGEPSTHGTEPYTSNRSNCTTRRDFPYAGRLVRRGGEMKNLGSKTIAWVEAEVSASRGKGRRCRADLPRRRPTKAGTRANFT